MAEKRREARYHAKLPLVMARGKDLVRLQTEDVSFRGVFLRMDEPPSLRQLVRLELTLPEGATIRTHAMVVYRVEPGGAQTPGAGMVFYGLDGRERVQWGTFVQRTRDESVVLTPSVSPERRFERHNVRFDLRPISVQELAELYARDLSQGRVAVATDVELMLGTIVGVRVVHPKGGEVLELHAIVRRAIQHEGTAGLLCELLDMDDARKQALSRFVGGPKALGIEIDEDDPRVA